MPTGRCPFCGRDGMDLEDSHYLSKGIYKGCRAEALANPNPILVSGTRMLQSSEQIHDFCLCWDCEQIFNKSGENWTVPRLGWQDKGFELWKLVKAAPYLPDDDLRTYACDRVGEIDCASIAHFGLGIFWKGHAHNWSGCPRTWLGDYGEELRKFLRLEAEFPKDTALIVRIVPHDQPLWSARPPVQVSKYPFHWFNFYVRGLDFTLAVGKEIPEYLRHCCFVGNPARPVMAGLHVLYDEWATMKWMMRQSVPSKNLAAFLGTPRKHSIIPPTRADW